MIAFLVDEHVDADLRSALRCEFPAMVIWAVGDEGAPTCGTTDSEILGWCEVHGCILLTNSRPTMPGQLVAHLELGRTSPGVIVLNPTASWRDTIEVIGLIWGAGLASDFANRVEYLSRYV